MTEAVSNRYIFFFYESSELFTKFYVAWLTCPPPPLIRFRLIKKADYKCSRINHCLIRPSLIHKEAHLLIIKCVHLYAMSIIHLLLGVFPIPVEVK